MRSELEALETSEHRLTVGTLVHDVLQAACTERDAAEEPGDKQHAPAPDKNQVNNRTREEPGDHQDEIPTPDKN